MIVNSNTVITLLVYFVASLLEEARRCLVTVRVRLKVGIAHYEVTPTIITCGITKRARVFYLEKIRITGFVKSAPNRALYVIPFHLSENTCY